MVDHLITSAGPADGQALQRLEKDCFAAVDVFKPGQFRHLLASPSCRTLVVRGGHGLILAEIIGLLRHFTIPSGRIYKVAVHPSAQGQGLGSRLIEAMEAEFLAAGMVKSFAEIRQGNCHSWALFQKHGYVPLRKLPRYYADGEDGVKFGKSLLPTAAVR